MRVFVTRDRVLGLAWPEGIIRARRGNPPSSGEGCEEGAETYFIEGLGNWNCCQRLLRGYYALEGKRHAAR